MSIVRKTIKGSFLLSSSEVINQACSLLRNIILARFLAKEDFGVAALLGLILTLFEMTGKMAFGQQVIQSRHGDDPTYIDSVHFNQLLVSAASTLLILLCAWPLSHFVAGPQYFISILLLGLIPFINGFNHLDVHRLTRRLNYGPVVLTEMIPQVVTSLAAWPLAVYFKDYRAVLWLLICKSILCMVITHLLAERRFTPRYNREWVKEGLKFGWPLLLAGLLQMGNLQGDSMVVAASYTLAQLGEYSVAMTIAMTPGLAILRISHSIALPLLSEVQHDRAEFSERYSRYAEIMALLSVATILGMLFCGEQLIVLLYGGKYAGVGALACFLIAAQSMRIMRGATVGAAMAQGDTINNLVSNLWRLSGLILAIVVGLLHASLTWFALTGIVGELIALTAAIVRLSTKHSIPAKITITPTAIGFGIVMLSVALKELLNLSHYSWLNWPLLLIAISSSVGVFMLCFPTLRTLIIEYAQKLRNRLKNAPLSAS